MESLNYSLKVKNWVDFKEGFSSLKLRVKTQAQARTRTVTHAFGRAVKMLRHLLIQ